MVAHPFLTQEPTSWPHETAPVRAPYGPTYATQIAIILLLIDNNLNIFGDSHLPAHYYSSSHYLRVRVLPGDGI